MNPTKALQKKGFFWYNNRIYLRKMLKKIKTKYKENRDQVEQMRNAPTAFDDALHSWVAPEFIRHERGMVWKITMPLLVFLAAFLGIYFGAWSFSIAIVAFAIVYWLIHRNPPKDVEVVISDVGLKVGNRRYPFSRIKAFWIIYEPPVFKTLYIRVSGDIAVNIPIQLEDEHPAIIREIMIEKIPELEGQKISLTETISRLLKL